MARAPSRSMCDRRPTANSAAAQRFQQQQQAKYITMLAYNYSITHTHRFTTIYTYSRDGGVEETIGIQPAVICYIKNIKRAHS